MLLSRRKPYILIVYTGIPEGNGAGEDSDGRPEDFPDIGNGSSSSEPRVPEERQEEIDMMKDCLAHSWATCVSYSGLSSNHRNRVFNYRGKSEIQNQAWRSCWNLCQHLYETREDDAESSVVPTLDLCRVFCKALFDARRPDDEAADSILRVSFELNNHLHNAYDRETPAFFQERTLEFYTTLCHRMMKRDTSLPDETDRLVRACWQMIEVLFNMRRSFAAGEGDDEEVLRNALHACDELMDQFKDGILPALRHSSNDKANKIP